jgi:hypothetical protein
MTFIYEEVTSENNEKMLKRTDENGSVSWVPTDPANSDYQRYLEEQAND